MIAYASRTGTKRNLAALRARGWRLMVSAAGVWRTEGFKWAGDNGQWTERDEAGPFKTERFERFLSWALEQPERPDFIVLPDIVCGGEASLELSLKWLRKLRRRKAWCDQIFMLAVQDGMEAGALLGRVKRMIGPKVHIFIGGGDEFKESTPRLWVDIAEARGAKVHAGRVNSNRRIAIMAQAGVNSIDGSKASRFATKVASLDGARRQYDLEGYLRRAA